MMVGSRQNLQSLTQQMDSLSTELNQTKHDIFGKLEVLIFSKQNCEIFSWQDNNHLLNETLQQWSLNFLHYISKCQTGPLSTLYSKSEYNQVSHLGMFQLTTRRK